MGSQDREPDAGGGQRLERAEIDGRLGQPHPFGVAAEAVAEVGDAPVHLGPLVVHAGQRHDDMVIHLGQSVAVPAAALRLRRSASTMPWRTSGAAPAIQERRVGPKLKLIQA